MNAGSSDADRSAASRPAPPAIDAEERPSAGGPLLAQVVDASSLGRKITPDRLRAFLAAPTVRQSLVAWLGRSNFDDKQQLVRRLNSDVAVIDRLLHDQVNAILHAPAFQRLEAAWRGLDMLARQVEEEEEPRIKIRVLHVTWKELERDFERAVEFDQSQLFRKVYEEEFGSPGGEPYGVLIGNYEVRPRPSAEHPHDDISILRSLSQVAAASFCPFLTHVHPSMFGLDSFRGMEHTLDHSRTMEHLDYLKWRALRDTEDARFVGLLMPRILMRRPYEEDGTRQDRFPFIEDVSGPDNRKYLWGGAAFAFASVLIRAFSQVGWLADIRGVTRDIDGGGLVTNLPVHCFHTDKTGVAPRIATDVVISAELEKEMSDLGFIPLCACKDSEYSVFYSNQSIQKPQTYDRPVATTNARISSMLQYMLCVSRFAHYIKVLGRDKVGAFTDAHDLEQFLQSWIMHYVTADASAPPDVKARFPLREARVQVRPYSGKPGAFRCVMHLAPHYELDEMTANVRLVAELTPGRSAS